MITAGLHVVLPVVVAVSVFVALGGPRRTVLLVTLPPGAVERSRKRSPAAPLAALADVFSTLRRLRDARRAPERIADDLPDVVDLMAVAAASGATVRLAMEAAARHHEGPAAAIVRMALQEVALGARLSEALSDTVDGLDRGVADYVRPLVSVLVDCDLYGTAAAPALQRLADDLRLHRQRRAETRARRVPVRLLLPLVLCVLPSFALLTVAPLFAGMARDALADDKNLPFEGTPP